MRRAEILTNGKTVWVNAPLCIGRFCRGSGEVQDLNANTICTTEPVWIAWKAAMRAAYGLRISDRYQPKWSK